MESVIPHHAFSKVKASHLLPLQEMLSHTAQPNQKPTAAN